MSLSFLSHLRVVESSAFIAAPLAGLTLSQFGADVIRVDTLGGGIDYGRLPVMPSGRSLYWTGLNKTKRSIAIDLKRPEGRELLRQLVAAPDTPGQEGGILLTNMGAPWLSHEALKALRSDVISCTIEGNPDGTTAVDYTVNCGTGYPGVTGGGSLQAPVNHVLPAWDIACAYQAAFAVLAAADRRRRSGEGAELRIALADIAFTMLSHLGLAAEVELMQRDREADGNHIYGAFGRDFGCADGQRVMVAAISAGQWKALVQACEMEAAMQALQQQRGADFGDEGQRYAARHEIAAVVQAWCGQRPYAEVRAAFERHRVCWGPYRSTRQLFDSDPRVGPGNPVWETLATPGIGTHRVAGSAVRAAGEARAPASAAPLLGQHTDEVLLDVLKLSEGEVGRLHDAAIVAGPEGDPTASQG